ncbi:MAG: DegV family protein [Tissierellia bacterium]|nr:DegV family protein [Tissierellia bacterium]
MRLLIFDFYQFQEILFIKNFKECLKRLKTIIVYFNNYISSKLVNSFSLLEWLSKGGRISKTVGYMGNALNIKPYLTIKDGEIILSKIIHGRKKTLQTLVNDIKEGTQKFSNQTIGISHADDLKTALKVEEKIKEKIKGCKTTIFEIGAVLGVHFGIGGVGVFYFDEKPEMYELN